MHLLYLTQVFELANDPGSDRHFYHCSTLAHQGHQVTAITSNLEYKTATAKYPGRGLRPIKVHVDPLPAPDRLYQGHRAGNSESNTPSPASDLVVWYVYSYSNIRGSFARRFWYYLTYLVAAFWTGLFVPRPDLIYAVSTPLTVGFLGYCLSRLRRVPFLFEVTDIWPDAAVATGVIQNRWLIQAAGWLERFCYRQATRVVILGETAKAYLVAKGVPSEKIVVITNGAAAALFQPPSGSGAGRTEVRKRLGVEDQFVCMYLGAHGRYNALSTLIDAAHELRHDPRYLFLLVGDGDEKANLQAQVRDKGLSSVRFLPPVPRTEAPALLQAADLFLLPNRRGEFYTMNLPNKLFDFMASARPIVVAGTGETGDAVQAAGGGIVVPAEDGAAMAQAIAQIASLEEAERLAMGEAARRYVWQRFDREQLGRRFLEVLEQATQSGGGS